MTSVGRPAELRRNAPQLRVFAFVSYRPAVFIFDTRILLGLTATKIPLIRSEPAGSYAIRRPSSHQDTPLVAVHQPSRLAAWRDPFRNIRQTLSYLRYWPQAASPHRSNGNSTIPYKESQRLQGLQTEKSKGKRRLPIGSGTTARDEHAATLFRCARPGATLILSSQWSMVSLTAPVRRGIPILLQLFQTWHSLQPVNFSQLSQRHQPPTATRLVFRRWVKPPF